MEVGWGLVGSAAGLVVGWVVVVAVDWVVG
jgi:hypothetical protein